MCLDMTTQWRCSTKNEHPRFVFYMETLHRNRFRHILRYRTSIMCGDTSSCIKGYK